VLVAAAGDADLELACRRGLKLSALTLGVRRDRLPALGPDSLADITNTNPQD
jgi:pseudouridine kinase